MKERRREENDKAGLLSVCDPHVEYRSTPPLGLTVRIPRLSWRIESARRGARQTACRILAAGDPGRLAEGRGDLWDSGWMETDRATFHAWGGEPLASRRRVWWRAFVRDETGAEAASSPEWFEMGLLDAADWTADWIGADLVGGAWQAVPCPYLRRSFAVDGRVERARLYVTALGCHRTTLNGRRTGDEELAPGWTHFRKRVRVSAHDVTALLQAGENVLGAVLGDGWYCGHLEKRPRRLYGDRPLLLVQLEIRYADGRETRVASDDSWRVGFGPLLASDLIMGEEYDARLEIPDWDRPGFDAGRWPAAYVAPDPGMAREGWIGPPIRTREELSPVADPRRGPGGSWIYDLGQNMVGRVRLRLSAPAGTTVTLRHAERLEADGALHLANLRTARATDRYTFAGAGIEQWEPSFTFHGFQYVELRGLREAPPRDAVTGVVLHSDWRPTAGFSCSNPLLNRLFQNIVWGWKGNSLDVPTDCPQRDERLGWTGDAQVFAGTAAAISEVDGFFAKWIQDLRDDQGADGSIGGVAPHSHLPGDWPDGGPGWADAMVVCPWVMFERYGDERVLRDHWPALRRWLAQQDATSRDGIRGGEDSGTRSYGDWLALDGSEGSRGATPHELIGGAFFARALDLGARIAAALGQDDDAAWLRRRHAEVREAFQRHFLTPAGRLVSGTQTAAVLALHFDLVPDGRRATVADALEADIRRRGMRLATGFLGTPFLMPALVREGRHATAAALLLQTEMPSWLYAVTQGATTVWERWDAWTPERGFQNPGMNSFNHYAFGAIGEWLLAGLAGVAPDPSAPGMQRLVLRPHFVDGLESASAWVDTPHGRVESAWSRTGDAIEWQVTLPANTAAIAHLPAGSAGCWRLDGKTLDRGGSDGGTEARLTAGRYAFAGRTKTG